MNFAPTTYIRIRFLKIYIYLPELIEKKTFKYVKPLKYKRTILLQQIASKVTAKNVCLKIIEYTRVCIVNIVLTKNKMPINSSFKFALFMVHSFPFRNIIFLSIHKKFHQPNMYVGVSYIKCIGENIQKLYFHIMSRYTYMYLVSQVFYRNFVIFI